MCLSAVLKMYLSAVLKMYLSAFLKMHLSDVLKLYLSAVLKVSVRCSESLPVSCAIKMAATASYSAVPSMFIVAPIGRTNRDMRGSILFPFYLKNNYFLKNCVETFDFKSFLSPFRKHQLASFVF